MFAACDTFRAAAIEQLNVWGSRIGAKVMSRPTGADASGLAFDAIAQARADGTDILFIDTAGRLQNKQYLMDELDKIVRVIKKQDEGAPHAVLLVLDATTGQNAMAQADIFTKVAGVTGLIMTKLDGTARGGILVAIAERFRIPVHAIGVGEQIDDLQPFDAEGFARAKDRLRRRWAPMTIVRADRLEPSKNIIRGFKAFDIFLRRRRDLRRKVKFFAFLVPRPRIC